MRTTWRVLAGHRDLRLVLSAGLISRTGDWILIVGLLYRVYAMTGSTVATALAMLSSLLPQVLLGSIAGVFADRWDRRRTMIAADVLLAAGLLPLLAVRGAGQVWVVFAVLAWEGIVEQFFTPAQQALVPRLVPGGQLLAANALNGQVSDISRLAGSGLGGVIAAAGGLSAVALADVASFAGSAVLLALVRVGGGQPGSEAPARQRLAAVAAQLRDGLRLTARHPMLRALLAFGLATSVGEGIFGTLITPFVRAVLHGSSAEFGLVAAAQAVGGIAGGVFAASLSQRFSATRLLLVSSVAFGLVDLGIFLYPLGYVALWPAVAGMIVTGLPSAVCVAALTTLFQRNTGDAYRGRVFGALGTAEGGASLAGTLAGGYLSRPLGIVPVLAVQGAGYVLGGLGMAAWVRAGKRHESQIAKARLISYNLAMPESPRSVPDDVFEVAAALRMSISMLVRKLRQAPPDELTLAEMAALKHLDLGGPATSSELARLDRISPQSMGTTLAALQQRGYVARDRDPGDGRRIVLSITEAGRRQIRERRGARTEQFARALDGGFSRAELEQLLATAPLLERLAEKL